MIPKEIYEEAQKECADIPFVEKITMEIYHDYQNDDEKWEMYVIKIPEIGDEFDIKITNDVMELSRMIEKQGGGHIEEFIYAMVMKQIRQDVEEKEVRDFFEDISD